jgi:hypothetical protein
MRALGICLLLIGLVSFGIIVLRIVYSLLGDYPDQNLYNIADIAWPICLAMIIVGAVLIIASLGWKRQTGSKTPGGSGELDDKPASSKTPGVSGELDDKPASSKTPGVSGELNDKPDDEL